MAAMIILARKLEPAMFGVVALADLIFSFLQGLSTQGMAAKVVQEEVSDESRLYRFAAAAFGWQILLAIPIMVLIIATAPLFSIFFHSPQLSTVLLVMSVAYFAMVCKSVPEAIVQRHMRFEILAFRDIIVAILTSGASVVLALMGFGIWSLMLPRMFFAPIEAISFYFLSRMPFRWTFDIKEWKKSFRFVGSVSASYILDFSNRGIDRIVVGKVLGQTALGIYSMATQWSLWFTQNVMFAIGSVMFPLLSNNQNNIEKSRSLLLKAVRRLFFVSAPTMLGLFAVAPEFVGVVYGHKWDAAVLPFRILLLHAFRKSVTSPVNSVALAFGCPERFLRIDMVFLLIYPITFWFGARFYGLSGVATAIFITQWIAVSIKIRISFKILKMNSREFFSEIYGIVFAVIGMLMAVFFVHLIAASLSEFGLLVLSIFVGVASYIGLVFIFTKDDLIWGFRQLCGAISTVKLRLFPI